MAHKSPFGVVRIDQEVHRRLTAEAKDRGQFVSWLANKIISEWLAAEYERQARQAAEPATVGTKAPGPWSVVGGAWRQGAGDQ